MRHSAIFFTVLTAFAASRAFGAMIIDPTAVNGAALNSTDLILDPASQKAYDTICQDDAKTSGIKDPENWVWSDDKQYCAPDALVSTGPTLDQRSEDTPQASQACSEGMDKCLQNCGQFKSTNYRDGEAGAWVGCRASCSYRCSPPRGGCWKGYCWAGCFTGVPLVEGVEWCYTTKTYSQSYSYVKCTSDLECNLNWKCAGPCAAF